MSKNVRAYSLWGREWSEGRQEFVGDDTDAGVWREYSVPSKRFAIEHSEATWGKHYDRVERREIEGGEALAWTRL